MSILTRKIELIPVGDKEERDRCYKWIRDFMQAQSEMMNQYMTALYVAAVQEISKEDRNELNRLYNRIPTSNKGSAFDKENCLLPKGLGANYGQRVRKDFDTACENGLLHGRISLPTYKADFPIVIPKIYVNLRENNLKEHNKSMGLYHNYSTYNELYGALKEGDPEIYWAFCNNMTYKLRFGNPYASAFLRDEVLHIFEGIYECMGSQLSIKSGGKKGEYDKIILHLSLNVPQKKAELDEKVVVGVDIGLAKPVVCALNNNFYKRRNIGDFDSFTNNRLRLQNQMKELSHTMKYTTGGHGRNKKTHKLSKLRQRERNFVHVMNHKFSNEVVTFAIRNHAKYINMEDLANFGKNFQNEVKEDMQFVFRNWSYFELQKMIEYKAASYGIVVRKVNPAFTSQTCSCCGKIGNRVSQATFICNDSNCISHMKYERKRKNGIGNYSFNADFNAARNIAMSENFTTKKKKSKAEKKAARKAEKEAV